MKAYQAITFAILINTMSIIKTDAINFSVIARHDLLSCYNAINTNTPMPFEKKYNRWMHAGLKKALKMAENTNSYEDYRHALMYYTNGFKDEHIFIKFDEGAKNKYSRPPNWPGFFVSYKHNKKFVISSMGYDKRNNNLPPISSELIACDGYSPQQIMARNVFPYYGNNKLEADWYMYTTMLLVNEHASFIYTPKSCKFVIDNKKIVNHELNWKEMDKNARILFDGNRIAYSYHPQSISILEISPNIVWISLPSFFPDNIEKLNEMNNALNKIHLYKTNKIIVLDVRGNAGGQSVWGTNILYNLVGKDYYNYKIKNNEYVISKIRVSRDNLIYLKKLSEQQPLQEDNFENLHNIEVALKQKKSLVVTNSTKIKKYKKVKSDFNGKIFIVSDGRCRSACWRFLWEASKLDCVTIVGAPSHAMSHYSENRFIALPSGFGQLMFPMARNYNMTFPPPNKAFVPKHRYLKDINDTIELKKWVLGLQRFSDSHF